MDDPIVDQTSTEWFANGTDRARLSIDRKMQVLYATTPYDKEHRWTTARLRIWKKARRSIARRLSACARRLW